MNVGAKIKYFRELKGITVNKLANKSGISQSYLRDIELGKKKPTVEYLEYICYGLDMTINDFFISEVSVTTELEKAIAKLTEPQKELLLNFLNSL